MLPFLFKNRHTYAKGVSVYLNKIDPVHWPYLDIIKDLSLEEVIVIVEKNTQIFNHYKQEREKSNEAMLHQTCLVLGCTNDTFYVIN
jgi:hypothetical protein